MYIVLLDGFWERCSDPKVAGHGEAAGREGPEGQLDAQGLPGLDKLLCYNLFLIEKICQLWGKWYLHTYVTLTWDRWDTESWVGGSNHQNQLN